MQKRSHKLLASTLLQTQNGFRARRFELAFLFGSFQPDCNPLTYLRGSLHGSALKGHNFPNTRKYIRRHVQKLQRRSHWTIWQYYALGKLTHYLADAFTFPHNDHFPDTMMDHHRYETSLRFYLQEHLPTCSLKKAAFPHDLTDAIDRLHQQYQTSQSDLHGDVHYILQATGLLMAACPPPAA